RWRPSWTIRVPESSSNGRYCAIPTVRLASIATPPSSKPMRTGLARTPCAGALRRGCGRSGATPRPSGGLSAGSPPAPIGRLVLARGLRAVGDRARVEREVKAVWGSAEMSAELETAVTNEFSGVIPPADDVARMDKRIGAKDFGAAMRAAKRLGPGRVAVV